MRRVREMPRESVQTGSLRTARNRTECDLNSYGCSDGERLTVKMERPNAVYAPQIAQHAVVRARTMMEKANLVQPTGVDQRGIGTTAVANGILRWNESVKMLLRAVPIVD